MTRRGYPSNGEQVQLQLARAVCAWRVRLDGPQTHAERCALSEIAALNTSFAEWRLKGGRGRRTERLLHAAVMALLDNPTSHRVALCACLAAMECVKGAVWPDQAWLAESMKAAKAEFQPFAAVHAGMKGGRTG